MDNTTKIEINLASSIVTDKPQESIAPILQAMLTSAGESIPKADPGFILNTGIERDGGITNLYVNQVNYTDIPASYFTSTLSNLLEVFPQSGAGQLATVKVNNKNIGTVSSIGVQSRIQTVLSDDIALTLTGTYLAMKMGTNSSGAVTITLTEYSSSTNAQIGTNTRTTTWTNITNISSSLTSISFIRYNGMKFTDSQEYALRLGTNLIILQESNLTAVIPPVATSVLGSNTIYTTCQYTYNSTTYTIFAGAGGTVGSFDGSNYKTYNGSGTGTGPYANGTSLNYTNSQTIYTSAVYGNFVIFGCATGLIASYNYTTKTWYSYNSGSGITSNAGVVSTDTITALGVVGGILFVGGSAGKLGSFIGVSWTAYNAGPGLCDNATLIGAVQINGIATYTSTEGIDILVAGASGRIGSGRLIPAGSFTNNASAFVSSMGVFPYGEVVYGKCIYVAASYNNYIYSSPDGINWTARTSTVMVNTPRIAFDAALGFVILCSGSSTYWVSSDGINWSSYTNIPITNTYDIACTGTGYFVVTPNGSGTPYTWQGLAYSWFAAGTSLPTGGWFLSYNNGYFVAYKNGSTSCYYSPSGYTWTAGGTLTSSQQYIGSGGGSFIAYGNGTSASLSTNHGVSWSAITLSNSVGVNELAYCNGVFFISTNTPGTFNYSSNLGSTWSTKTISNPPGAGLAGAFIGYGPIGLVGVDNNGSFIIPNNALTLAPYTTATTTLAPTNNGTVVSTDNILTATPYYDPVLQTNEVVFTSSAGKIGYVTSAGSWLNYNSIYGVSNNATAVSTDSINVVCVSGNNFIIGSSAGKVATYTGSAWLNYNAGGTTPYVNNATVIGTSAIWGLDIINGSLMVSGVGGSMNSISNTNTVTPSWTIGGSGVSTILQGFTDLFYLYIYRYELTSQTVAQTSPGITSYSSNYLIDIVGNSQGKVLIINTSALSGTVLSGQYAWPQVSNGLTRHIVSTSGPLAGPTTAPYLVSGSAAYNIGIAGYTTFNTTSGYSNTEVFSSFLTLGAGVAVVANGTSWYRAAGFNYAEMAYTTTAGAANVYQVYAPQFVPTATDYNNSAAQQTNSPFLLDHYGKLTNGFGVSPINGQAFEIRYNVIDSGGAGLGSPGTQQYLSAAMINGATDNLGVILTNVGEIDNTYAPHITNDNTILYRYGGNFFFITLGQPTNYIQRITDRLYKINTLSPLNNYDDLTNTL